MSADQEPRGGESILLDDVSKTFGVAHNGFLVQAVRNVSLRVEDGSFVALHGPSGCGKTTVLRLLDGLVRPDGGKVTVFGRQPEPGPDVGFVFQSFRLIPWATVRKNIEFGLSGTSLDGAERRERVDHYLRLTGLSRFASAYPRMLSGGMKQRVALARALAPEPRLLLMDEPFASIDAQTRELMQYELMKIGPHRRPAVVFVTHSVDEAIVLADRIAVMSPQPGTIVETVDVDLERPRWTYDARAMPRFSELRHHLSTRLREMVLNDPASEFFGSTIGGPEVTVPQRPQTRPTTQPTSKKE